MAFKQEANKRNARSLPWLRAPRDEIVGISVSGSAVPPRTTSIQPSSSPTFRSPPEQSGRTLPPEPGVLSTLCCSGTSF